MSETVAEALAFEQFRNNIRRVAIRTDIVDSEDVWMIECAGGLCFLFEAV
jgi:hypothetical protein